MTLSDDLLCNPACWPSSHALRIRARLVSLMELPQVSQYSVATTAPPAPKNDPSSVTEPESKPENPPPVLPPPKNDQSSVTEPESEPKNPPPVLPPPKNDPSSVTEPENDVEEPQIKTPIKSTITIPKKRGFFDTPSPPGPDSLYWKYVSQEEDAKWYDRSHTDNSFLTVHRIKQELKDLS
ncbi:uncharacterized protein F5147DRAFT_661248 [Suillus discolor]|uniref:Uncharacterized protein n=1 Tax=Suillus discolor TaxID=1912936 RepID=A0A9P7EPY8_9AGAM|nr:uncharacterized protein F5147DRAFT_661248 [Suillus discolor]KAG2080464.1 hypothetical protein F5147DRAFT_661248 [Suillus discolor]